MEQLTINKIKYNILAVYDISVTVPDSFVVNNNKTCNGHGEAKFYMGPKDVMRNFYTGNVKNEGFVVDCFVLKRDLLQYMQTIHHEYQYPSIKYRGMGTKKNMQSLWDSRLDDIQSLDDVLLFQIQDQNQIEGPRGYVKVLGKKNDKNGYQLIREISLPFVSYVSVMKLQEVETDNIYFYWKLFTDFTQMAELQYLAKNYGKKKNARYYRKRDGQIQYKQKLYEQFKRCPFTKIDDTRLLIASHIKPWAICNNNEKTDVSNGLLLSPLFDKLFDRGFISFKDNGELIISDWLSEENKNRIDFNYDIENLNLTPERKSYLEYHRSYVLK